MTGVVATAPTDGWHHLHARLIMRWHNNAYDNLNSEVIKLNKKINADDVIKLKNTEICMTNARAKALEKGMTPDEKKIVQSDWKISERTGK